MLRGLECNWSDALEAKQLAFRVARFDDAVGHQHQRLMRGQASGDGRVVLIGREAKRQGRRGLDFGPVDVRSDVARVGQRLLAGESDADAAGGSEADLALRDERIVEAEEDLAGIVRGFPGGWPQSR